jgi:hypothetical protein
MAVPELPQHGGEVQGHGTRGDAGAHLCREVWSKVTAYVAARGCTSCSLSWLRACTVFKVLIEAPGPTSREIVNLLVGPILR